MKLWCPIYFLFCVTLCLSQSVRSERPFNPNKSRSIPEGVEYYFVPPVTLKKPAKKDTPIAFEDRASPSTCLHRA